MLTKGSITGKPPIQPKHKHVKKKPQTKKALTGLKVELLIINRK